MGDVDRVIGISTIVVEILIGGAFMEPDPGTMTSRKALPFHLPLVALVVLAACAPGLPPAGPNSSFSSFDEPPMPIGGIDALIQNIPADAKGLSADGPSILSFYISSNGRVTSLNKMMYHSESDVPVFEAILATAWAPAKLMGAVVGAWIKVPVELNSGKILVRYPIYDHPPAPIGGNAAFKRQLRYPMIAREAGIEGLVIVHARINEEGVVTSVFIQKGIPNTGLDEAAIDAVEKTRFNPAMLNGVPVGTWMTIPVDFRLRF